MDLVRVHDSAVQMKRQQNSVGTPAAGSSVAIAAKDPSPSLNSVRTLSVPPQESVTDQAAHRLARWAGKQLQPRPVSVPFVRAGDVKDVWWTDGFPAVLVNGIGAYIMNL